MDGDGYPTEENIKLIRQYAGRLSDEMPSVDFEGLMGVLENCWHLYPPRVGKKYIYLDTAGWSGNEDIVSVLMDSLFWFIYWESSQRGGHYKFRIPKNKLSR